MKSMQVKALIRNLSKKKNVNPQILLRIYVMEKLLERIACSKYNKNFILKGGMLISSLVGLESRTTLDMDTTIKNIPLDKDNIKKFFNEIISINLNDSIDISLLNIIEIREDAEYKGFRLSLIGKIDESKIPIKVDITTGDVITPSEVKYSFKLLFDNKSIDIFTYNIETVLAEKLEAILSRSTENTRMRDYYDVHILFNVFNHEMNFNTLAKAIINTFSQRNSLSKIKEYKEIIDKIYTNQNMHKLWDNYILSNNYIVKIEWKNAINSIKEIFNQLQL